MMYLLSLAIVLQLILSALGGDVNAKHEKFLPDYRVYHNVSSITDKIQQLAADNPNFIKLDLTYRSRMGQPQMVMRITNFTTTSKSLDKQDQLNMHKAADQQQAHHHLEDNVKVLFSFGEHAREFLPVESLLHFLNAVLVCTKSSRCQHSTLSNMILNHIDLYIVGIVNPDGRLHIERNGNYCWRGTGNGVDLNRNFDWHYGARGSSADKHDEEYRGTHPFSEPESYVLKELTEKINFDAFVSFHSGIQHIYLPYADTYSKLHHVRPYNIDAMLEVAHAMSVSTRFKFSYGIAYELNDYTADGTVFDYMSGVRQIPFSLAVEMWGVGDRPELQCFDLFNPPNNELPSVVRGLFPMYETFLTHLVKWKRQSRNVALADDNVTPPSLTFGYVLLGLVIVVTMVTTVNKHVCCTYPRRRVISLRSLSATFTLLCLL